MTVRRLKTHSAQSGYVYQYYFVGRRAATADDADAPAEEFVFDVTLDGSVVFAVSVFLQAAAVETWAEEHGRSLNQAEQYAAAKLGLLRELDGLPSPGANARRAVVRSEDIEVLLRDVGLE